MKLEIRIGSSTRQYTTRSGAAYITVGSRPDSDIVIDDPAVSPIHLKFEHFVDRWSYTDQMSDTGTKHNGETKYSAELAEGDKVEVGSAVLKVVDLLTELDVAPKPARTADRSWQDEVKPSAANPTSTYKRRVEDEYRSNQESAYSSGKDTDYSSSSDDADGYHRGTDHARQTRPATVAGRAPAGTKPANKAGVVIVMLVVFVLFGGGVAFALLDAGDSYDGEDYGELPESAPATTAGSSSGDSGTNGGGPAKVDERMSPDEEKRLKSELDALVSNANEDAPIDKLAAYEKIKAEAARYKSHGLEWPLERAFTAIRLQLFREMQERYGTDNGDVYDLEKANKYAEALERVNALATYLDQTDLHRELAKSSEMDKYVARKLPELEEANDWYIGECFARADEALQRNDFAAAEAVLTELRQQARLDESLKSNLDAEVTGVAASRKAQENGELPAKREPFDRRKDKLPRAPESKLLPKSDSSSYAEMNQLKTRLEKAWKAGEIDDASCTFYGRAATLLAKTSDWRMVLNVDHECANGVHVQYKVRYAQHQLPPETMISLYEAIQPSRNELLAMLLTCFNEGLIEESKRIACKLWHADESVKADLDQLLATKFGIEVPEGGFVERDGKLVAPD
ncbi:MAG: FHA domain-containing protein [Planctomycetes bacterium]|nr:FHA domain-containing protein [Planctomycetota bacterium]